MSALKVTKRVRTSFHIILLIPKLDLEINLRAKEISHFSSSFYLFCVSSATNDDDQIANSPINFLIFVCLDFSSSFYCFSSGYPNRYPIAENRKYDVNYKNNENHRTVSLIEPPSQAEKMSCHEYRNLISNLQGKEPNSNRKNHVDTTFRIEKK